MDSRFSRPESARAQGHALRKASFFLNAVIGKATSALRLEERFSHETSLLSVGIFSGGFPAFVFVLAWERLGQSSAFSLKHT